MNILPYDFSPSGKIKFAFQVFILCSYLQIWGWNIAFLHVLLLENYFIWSTQASAYSYSIFVFIPASQPQLF